MDGYRREKVWDPAIRLWHWLLAGVVSSGWYFGEFMSFTTIEWHFYCGYAVLGLLGLRLVWGMIGPGPVRLSRLFGALSQLPAYARRLFVRQPSGTPGHNPLGSLSVIAMIALLLAQAGTGLFIVSDDFFEQGPLAHWVDEDTALRLSAWHHRLSRAIAAVVLLHVAAIGFYRVWKREDLLGPMITGWKWVRRGEGGADDAGR